MPLFALMRKVLTLFRKASCQMMGNVYVYMAILEGLAELEGYNFDEHDVMQCFALKGSPNKFSL